MTSTRITQLHRAARTTPARAQARRAAPDDAAEPRRRHRVGRPRGPRRIPLATRILPEDDTWLTAALEQTGLGLRDGVTQAQRLWCKKLKVPVPTAHD
ncbi:hypothetical protein OH797_03500 [Streptomyces anulatus]|uniref:hypothetical protein n=1 Tax=Streptomyces TaxID=1883 RepID=UPI0016752091|nr:MULTISPECIES: hypothetical protein [Streptomyces]MBT1100404.1 hypothetical protein [Streptomyces sp. Tu10]WTC61663.1 hypothetical protein OG865_03690 [Streptomyces anulatus]WUC85194.1 hypothetical protein OHQ35_03605 [Streptomyces anulatus]WUD87280.1 hypothetical protein OG703_03635 [Streptomyces anulatus]GGY39408.1 hypothetical protein GCM10010342_28390 [Streptomyces anulatus]